MREHGTIKSRFWNRGSGKLLRGDMPAQLVATYLMTCASGTMVGIFHIAIPTIAHDIGLTIEQVEAALNRLGTPEIGIALYDHEEELVYLPAMAEHQIGESLSVGDRRRQPLLAMVKSAEEERFMRMFVERYRERYHLDVLPVRIMSAPDGSKPNMCGRSYQDFFPRGPGLLASDEPRTWTDSDGDVFATPRTLGRLKPGKNPSHARLREFVRRRAGFKCEVCGVPQSEHRSPHVADHIISRANGGSHHPDNLQCLCDSCNSAKVGIVDAKGGLS